MEKIPNKNLEELLIKLDSDIEKSLGLKQLTRLSRRQRDIQQENFGRGLERLVKFTVEESGANYGRITIEGNPNSIQYTTEKGLIEYIDKVQEKQKTSVTTKQDMQEFTKQINLSGKELGTLVLKKDAFSIKELAKAMYLIQQVSPYINVSIEKEKYKLRSRTDHLTGVLNRRRFEQILKQTSKESLDTKEPYSIFMIDLAKFKQVNDTYGHAHADLVLKEMANVLKKNTRQNIDKVARFGGDEFLILAPGLKKDDAKTFAEKLENAIREHDFPKAGIDSCYYDRLKSNKIIADIGYASGVGFSKNFQELIRDADKILYNKKDIRQKLLMENFEQYSEMFNKRINMLNRNYLEMVKESAQNTEMIKNNNPNESFAIVYYDVIGFSAMIEKYGKEKAWKEFNNVIRKLRKSKKCCDLLIPSSINRNSNSDQIITTYYQKTNHVSLYKKIEQICEIVGSAAREIIKEYETPIDIAIGATIYVPEMVIDEEYLKSLSKEPFQIIRHSREQARKSEITQKPYVINYFKQV